MLFAALGGALGVDLLFIIVLVTFSGEALHEAFFDFYLAESARSSQELEKRFIPKKYFTTTFAAIIVPPFRRAVTL